MPVKFTCYILLICLFVSCASTNQANSAPERLSGNQLMPVGRTAVTNGALELISSASHFAYSFSGTECKVYGSIPGWQDHNYLQYELDGLYKGRLRLSKSDRQPIVIPAGSDAAHTIKIYKATEAHTGPLFIHWIEAKKIKAIKPPNLPLIEFIGNSITCGAAADPSEVPCGTGDYHDQHNAFAAYGPRVARALNVDFLLSSVSGIGIYRNWNSDGPTMPQVYEKTDFQREGTRSWDFKKYVPKVLSIALGTNDFSAGDGKKQRSAFDSASFVINYIGFIKQLKSHYPDARIALLSSPMINGERRTLLQNCISAVKESIDRLYPGAIPLSIHFFKPMQARGCSGHPGVEDHAIMANELLPFFRKLLE